MHAGDGNVHTNIPVNSDDYDMLQTAHEAVARIMVLARSLDVSFQVNMVLALRS
jgi:FAD/FMN-containing dehydrogenase